jgi:2-polyprenyl-3-methyl-5-hydroxy-6-metoxy-1,4-benzoquinol methylase
MVDRYSYRIENGSPPGLCRYQMPAEEFFLSHHGYDFILSCAVIEHLYNPLAALRAMAKALNPGGVMIHAVDCRSFLTTFTTSAFCKFHLCFILLLRPELD